MAAILLSQIAVAYQFKYASACFVLFLPLLLAFLRKVGIFKGVQEEILYVPRQPVRECIP